MVRLLVKGMRDSRYRPVICCLKELGPKGEEIRNGGTPAYSGLLANRLDPRVLPKLVGLMRRERVRVLYCLDHDDAMFWGRIAAKVVGVPAVVTAIHTYGKWGNRRSVSWPNRMLLPLTHRVVAVAQKQKEYLAAVEGLAADRIDVIPNGIEVERFVGAGDERPSGIKRVSMIAAIRPEKGHEVLLRAAAEVLAEANPVCFWIVGDGPARPSLEALADRLGILDSVSFLGFRRDIPRVLAQTDVAALASYPVVETLPVCLLEAMAAGKPVVATRVGAVEEVVLDAQTGYLVPPGDPSALAQAILALVKDEDLATGFGRAGQARVREHFSAERMVERTQALFDRMLLGTNAN